MAALQYFHRNIAYPKLDLIKIKHFLGKAVTDEEIRQALRPPFPQDQLEYEMDRIREDLGNPEILIYEIHIR